MKKNTDNVRIASWLLRLGLAAVFLYAGVSSLLHPLIWIGFLPIFMTNLISGLILIKFFAAYELFLTVWLLSGKFLRYCAILCALTLAGIVASNPSQLTTTFRDVGLAFMAVALALIEQ